MPTVRCVFMGKTREPGGCEIYRGNMPLYYLGEKSKAWRTNWIFFEDWFKEYDQFGSEYLLRTVLETDVFIFPRLVAPDDHVAGVVAEFFKIIRDLGKRIVYEVDDDYTNRHRKVIDGSAMRIAAMCDAITVTTPHLAQLMSRETRRPVYVLPNMIDPKMWRDGPSAFKAEGKLRIGLTGSTTHKNDWAILKNVLPDILAGYENVELLLGGYHPDYLEAVPNTIRLPGIAYDLYAQAIRSCDIVLAPVDPNDGFNLGKSPIKAVEGMGAGALAIATNNEVYQLAIRDQKTGLLVEHTEAAWDKAIRWAIENPAEREALRRRGWQHAWNHYDISRESYRWGRVYQKVIDAPPNPIKL